MFLAVCMLFGVTGRLLILLRCSIGLGMYDRSTCSGQMKIKVVASHSLTTSCKALDPTP